MDEQWPAIGKLPEFPAAFSSSQLEILRALSRYACGIWAASYVFPETNPKKQYPARDILDRRIEIVQKKCGNSNLLDRNNIDAFCSKGFSFKFPDKSSFNKIRRIYYYVYLFIRDDLENHRPILGLAGSLYLGGPDIEDVTLRISEFVNVKPETLIESSPAVCGVFYLYRYGGVTDEVAELIRSVVRIALVDTKFGKRLRFTLVYESGDAIATGPICEIEGSVLPREKRFFVPARDTGTKNGPCLLILERKPGSHRFLSGVMLRVNTLGKIAATKVYLKRLTEPSQEDDPAKIDKMFLERRSDAKILSLNEELTKKEIEAFEKLINNKVDMETSFMLTAPTI
jgi:hypothetical protein